MPTFLFLLEIRETGSRGPCFMDGKACLVSNLWITNTPLKCIIGNSSPSNDVHFEPKLCP